MAISEIQLTTLLQENARRLELQVVATRLLVSLFQESGEVNRATGRYHFIEQAIEQHPPLFQALLDNNPEAIQQEWSQVLLAHQSDVHFLHGLAVIYREYAVTNLVERKQDQDMWLRSTILWVLLLSTEAFWDYFSEARFIPDKGKGSNEERISLDETEQQDLLKKTLQTILSLHSTHGSKNFAGRHYKEASIHFNCLYLCRRGREQILIEALRTFGVHWNLGLDKYRLEQIGNIAEGLLDGWCLTLVQEAEKIVEDAETIRRLPQGIRKNYEGGIHHLEPFIKLHLPVVRVLSSSLDWYNDWCYDLYVTKDIKRIKELMKPAREVAEQLVPLSTKGLAYKRENQVLSQHYLLRGFTTDDPEKAVKEYEIAIEWNSANANAEKLLGDSYQEVLMRQLEEAIKCVERKQFENAYQILDAVEKKAKDKSQVKVARAVVHFRHADELASEGRLREALTHAEKALQLEPGQPVILELVTMLQKLMPEENNLQYMHSAKDAFDRGRYDKVLESASMVAGTSRFYTQACDLLSAAYFRRGIEVAKQAMASSGGGKQEKLEQAIADLECARTINRDREVQKVITNQLEIIREAASGVEIEQAMKSGDLEKVEQILRDALANETSRKGRKQLESQLSMVFNARAVKILNEAQKNLLNGSSQAWEIMDQFSEAKSLLEEAIRLDPSNKSARTNLDSLRKIR